MMIFLQSWWLLIYFDLLMQFRGFASVEDALREQRVRIHRKSGIAPEQICQAVTFASVLYFKPVLCLQRSAALVALLRKRGFQADVVLGTRLLPFTSHAWVEIGGCPLNDTPSSVGSYQVMDRWRPEAR